MKPCALLCVAVSTLPLPTVVAGGLVPSRENGKRRGQLSSYAQSLVNDADRSFLACPCLEIPQFVDVLNTWKNDDGYPGSVECLSCSANFVSWSLAVVVCAAKK